MSVLLIGPAENVPPNVALYGPPYELTADVPPICPSANVAVMRKSAGVRELADHSARRHLVPSSDE